MWAMGVKTEGGRAMNKVEKGIKGLINQATARFKLFQEMPQDCRGFREWSQLVVEQANRCDWTNYDKSKAARRDTIPDGR